MHGEEVYLASQPRSSKSRLELILLVKSLLKSGRLPFIYNPFGGVSLSNAHFLEMYHHVQNVSSIYLDLIKLCMDHFTTDHFYAVFGFPFPKVSIGCI
jgi:hypothetical protein